MNPLFLTVARFLEDSNVYSLFPYHPWYPWDWYIYLHENLNKNNHSKVGKYTMDGMGYDILGLELEPLFVFQLAGHH